jgi:hypothetical protein
MGWKAVLSLVALLALGLTIEVVGADGRPAKSREENVRVFESRKITIEVPEPMSFSTAKDENGLVVIKLADRGDTLNMELRILPDVEGRFANARARKELMYEMFNEYVDSATEKAMQFEELDPRVGAGTYCVFTDAKLVGKTTLPPGEYLHLTAGLKAFPGVLVVFRCFSNDTTSAEYQSLMKMLRESVQERPVPLK